MCFVSRALLGGVPALTCQPDTTFVRTAVSLQTASRLGGKGHFKKAAREKPGKGLLEVPCAPLVTKILQELCRTFRGFSTRREELLFDLRHGLMGLIMGLDLGLDLGSTRGRPGARRKTHPEQQGFRELLARRCLSPKVYTLSSGGESPGGEDNPAPARGNHQKKRLHPTRVQPSDNRWSKLRSRLLRSPPCGCAPPPPPAG